MNMVDFFGPKHKIAKKQWDEQNKKTLLAIDLLVVIIILCSAGALYMTNKTVAKQPGTTIVEANPYTCENLGLECHPQAKQIFNEFKRAEITYGILIGAYWILRKFYYGDLWLVAMIILITILALGSFMDFTNDLGFYA